MFDLLFRSEKLNDLVNAREQEEISLQILLSQRRKRQYDEMAQSHGEASSASQPSKQIRLPQACIMAVIKAKAANLHAQYNKLDLVTQAFVL